MLKWPRRILLFLLVNILVVVTISIVLNFAGVRPYLTQHGIDFTSLMVFCLVWGFGGALISLALSRLMAKWMMGVQVIDPDKPGSTEEQWLVTTVHHLAREAGIDTMPEVGYYESPEPNAFATGPTKNRALVAVSSGLFQAMRKDEIEGVLGHEITHVTNGDMVTMTLLQGIINAFVLFLARVIAALLSRSNDREGGSSYFMVMMIQMVLSFLGMIPLMAFSRWREYRADAGGARLAGRESMIRALQALLKAQNIKVPDQPAAIAAFKISGTGGSLFARHPPLEERIERLRNASLTITED
jgi:heat shock protein HtpX